jgi:Mn-dependent DtxR family transcriptional regulator
MRRKDVIKKNATCWSLTEAGRSKATKLVRAHRLWEVYLDNHFPQDAHQLHYSAERLEHVTTQEMQSRLGDAKKDPHGSKVPDESSG